MTISELKEHEQNFIMKLAEQCKLHPDDAFKALIETSVRCAFKGDVKTIVENGFIKVLVLSPDFFKYKDFDLIAKLPELEELYLSEGHQKSKANRVRKIHIGKESKIHTVSVCASKLKDLVIENDGVKDLEIAAPELATLELSHWGSLKRVAISGLSDIDLKDCPIPWDSLSELVIKNLDIDIPFPLLKNCITISISNYYNRGVEHFKGNKIAFQSDRLESLKLWETGIRSLDLKRCVNLKEIDITEKGISKFDFCPDHVVKLDIFTDKKTVKIRKVKECLKLEELRMRHVPDMNVKLELPHLKYLSLFDMNTITLDTVKCESLQHLKLYDGSVTHVKMKKGELYLNNRVSRLKDIDITESLMLNWFSYFADQVKGIKLICRESHHLFHKFLKKDFSEIEDVECSAQDLEDLRRGYNWDFGKKPLFWIANHKNCDKGTALKIYWANGPGYFTKYESPSDIPPHEREAIKLKQDIEKLYLSGYYKTANYAFDPHHEHTGYYEDVQNLDRLPPEMLEPV